MDKSEKSKIVLIPWHTNPIEHTERLYLQRVACGWKEDMIEIWRCLPLKVTWRTNGGYVTRLFLLYFHLFSAHHYCGNCGDS
ncbi:hypothetical protein V1524DRAFT_24420 [Lipomyces starkeyi]